MSNQSGITSSQELINAFKRYVDGSGRAFIIKIDNEQLVPGTLVEGGSTLSDDWSAVQQELSENDPAFVVVRKDNSKDHIFISFTPDYASVRSKMIYASSKNTLLRELGLEFFKPVIFINDIDEISESGWKAHLAHEEAENPLTESERAFQKVKNFENLNIGTERRTKLVNDSSSGFLFEVDSSLKDKLASLSNGELVSCTIDLSNESIKLSGDSTFKKPSEIVNLISSTEPQYTVLSVNDKISFIYSCPSGSKVKARMVYASSKLGFVNQFLTKEVGLEIHNVIEVGDLDEIELSKFEVIPDAPNESTSNGLRFSKPKGPRRR